MGMKYEISAFNYPYRGAEKYKQTAWLLVAIIYVIMWSMTYDGVDMRKRSAESRIKERNDTAGGHDVAKRRV